MRKKLVIFMALFMWQSLGFAPPKQQLAEERIYFAAIGDYGKDNVDEADVAALVNGRSPDFIITLGDNNYNNGCMETIDRNIGKYFHQYIYNYRGRYGRGSLERRFFPSLGNHDWRAIAKCPTTNGSLPYVDYFDLLGNERYYDFVKGPVHFFALDSDYREPDGNEIGSIQYEWFRNTIERSTAPFKIVYFHHPPYSSGKHGNQEDLQWDFTRLGVDLVMAGHDHIYERIERGGITYIVNGLGGASPYDIEYRVPGSKIVYNREHGAVFVDATEQTLRVSFVNHLGNKIDETLIQRR